MTVRKCFYVFALIALLQSPVYSMPNEEAVFYEQIIQYYKTNDMQKFYSLLSKFQKMYPSSSYKNTLYTLAAKKLYENKRYKDALFFFNRIDDGLLSKMQDYFTDCHIKLKNYEYVVQFYEKTPFINKKSKKNLMKAYLGIINDKNKSQEKRKKSITKAIEILEAQNKRSLTSDDLLTLSKLYYQNSQFEKSTQILTKLLKDPEFDKEEILIQMALIKTKTDPKKAISLLNQAIALNSKQKELASYRKLKILFENKEFKELITTKDEFEQVLSEDKAPLLHYYLGIAFLKNKEISEAEKHFNIYLVNAEKQPNLKLLTLKYLRKIAEIKKDKTLLNNLGSTIAEINQIEEEEQIKSKILSGEIGIDIAKAQSYKKEKNYEMAENILIRLLENKSYSKNGVVNFELAHVYYLSSRYEKTIETLISFISKYPNSKLVPLAWNYYIESSIKIAKNSPSQTTKSHLMFNLVNCLKNNRSLTRIEKIELMFLLARTQYELQAFEESIVTVNKIIRVKNLNKKILSKCYLLLGFSYKNGHNNKELYEKYIKKAIETNPTLLENSKVKKIYDPEAYTFKAPGQ